jgi:hypothetical protein
MDSDFNELTDGLIGKNQLEPDFNQLAEQLIAKDQLEEARIFLEGAVQQMPYGWKPIQEDEEFIRIVFWDQEEFFAYNEHSPDELAKSILWAGTSYSRAWYILSALASKQEPTKRGVLFFQPLIVGEHALQLVVLRIPLAHTPTSAPPFSTLH